MSERHREALAHLLYGVRGQGGFVVLTGEVGTGKTTTCRCFLNQVPKNTDVAYIVNPKLSARELLASICDEFGVPYAESASIKVLNDAINKYLLDAHARDRHTVLIIDEAQNLRVDVLEQLRLLTNLETSEKKLLQIILLGQPELRDMLAEQELRQLAQRVTARYHLHALNRAEVGAYVACRLAVAGRKPRLFAPAAIKKLYRYSGGIPRLINLLADRALLGAYASHSEQVEPYHIRQAYYEIQGESDSRIVRFFKQYGGWSVGAVCSISLFFVLGLWSKSWLETVSPVVAMEYHETQGDSNTQRLLSDSYITGQTQETDLSQASVAETSVGIDPLPSPSSESTYIEDFHQALSTSTDTLVAYVEAPTPDTNLLNSRVEGVADTSLHGETLLLGIRKSDAKGKYKAYQSVFESWNMNYSGEPFRLACDFAELNGLRCLHKQGNWRSLLRIDRPAILTLFNEDGQTIYVALLKIEADQAVVAHAGEQFRVSLDEIDRYWLGEYSVIWSLPPYKSGLVMPGQLDESSWLREGLSQINPALKGMPLEQQVKEFQRSVGLVPDGIAGSMTIIQMNNLLQSAAPRLLGRS
jgi:general secretion pathway protein A